MIVTRLLYSVGETEVTEYPDFEQALADLQNGENRDFANMTLFEIDLDTNQIGRTYDGVMLKTLGNREV